MAFDGDGTRVAAAAAWRRPDGRRPTPPVSLRHDRRALGSLGARSLRAPGDAIMPSFHLAARNFRHTPGLGARAAVTPLEKVLLIGCARLWAATAMSGTRGACVVLSDQAPRRARSMGARGSGLFNGVTQNASLLAFQRSHKRHSWHFNVTLGISSGYRDCGLPVICS